MQCVFFIGVAQFLWDFCFCWFWVSLLWASGGPSSAGRVLDRWSKTHADAPTALGVTEHDTKKAEKVKDRVR